MAEYNEIWNRILKIINTKIHSGPVYDGKYIKHFKKLLTQLFQTIKLKKKRYSLRFCNAVNVEYVVKTDKKNYFQVYLEDCKCKIKKKNMIKFIEAELKLDDSDDSGDSNE